MTMVRWLQRLFSSPAAAPAAPVPPVPAPPATAPEPVAAALAQAQATPAPRGAAAPVSFEQRERVDGAWNAWLFDRAGTEAGGLDLADAETRVLDVLAAILASRQSGAALVRRLPGLVPQLLQSLRSDTFSGSALSCTISSDVVLVAAVIRLANGCRHSGGKAVTSVEHAVILLGQEGLRQLITTVAFRPIVDVNSGFHTRRLAPRLWEHAERCALGARRLAADAEPGIEPFDAFLAGLLQNVGLIVSLRIMDQVAPDGHQLGSDVFLARLARDTRRLCASIAREWTFPETVVRALLEQGEARRGAVLSPLGRLLKVTDYLGKARMLAEHGLLDEAHPALFAGLPPYAPQCYAVLAESRDPAAQA